jgi:hypothetical protein
MREEIPLRGVACFTKVSVTTPSITASLQSQSKHSHQSNWFFRMPIRGCVGIEQIWMFNGAENRVSNQLHCHSGHLAVFDAFTLPMKANSTLKKPRREILL